jgi:dual specificity phosphatase 12
MSAWSISKIWQAETEAGIWLGSVEGLKYIHQHNITATLTCQTTAEQPRLPDLACSRRLSIKDDTSADMLAVLDRETRWLIDRVLSGDRIFVHCWAGVSRSATIVTAFLMRHLDLECDSALDLVRKARPRANPSWTFRHQLQRWQVWLWLYRVLPDSAICYLVLEF